MADVSQNAHLCATLESCDDRLEEEEEARAHEQPWERGRPPTSEPPPRDRPAPSWRPSADERKEEEEEEEEEAVRDMVDVDAIKEDEGRMKERRGRGGRNEAKLVNVDVGVIRDRKPFYQ